VFRAPRLGGGDLGVERVNQARDDFVLAIEEIAPGFIELLGPEMTARFGVASPPRLAMTASRRLQPAGTRKYPSFAEGLANGSNRP
jgi:hypothetical protein